MKIVNKTSPVLILAVSLLILVSGCTEHAQQQKQSVAPRPVKLLTIEDSSQSRTFTYPATIDAVQSSKLAFQVGGKLETVNIIAAQEVSQGAQLASLEKRTFQNQLNSAQAQYQTAKADFERAKTLAKDGVISARELEQLNSKNDVAVSTYDSAKKALSDSTLFAPYDAIVAAVPVKALENVSAGQHIVTLFGKGQMEAIVNIPASIVVTVDARSDRQAFVILEATPETPIHATFRRANLEADAASQTYEVRFAFTPPKGLNILPGMNASLRIEFAGQNNSENNTVSVPTFAIFQEDGQHFVWKVIGDPMTVSKTLVTIQDGIGEKMIITSGLQVGETIVGAGANYLTEGITVRPWTKS